VGRHTGFWRRRVSIDSEMFSAHLVGLLSSCPRFWDRAPTRREWLVQAILSINHGALGDSLINPFPLPALMWAHNVLGIIPWLDPTPPDIKMAASSLAKSLPVIKEFLFSHGANFSHFNSNRIDISLWTVDSETLILATNLNPYKILLPLSQAPITRAQWWIRRDILNEGVQLNTIDGEVELLFEAMGVVVFTVSHDITTVNRLDDEL